MYDNETFSFGRCATFTPALSNYRKNYSVGQLEAWALITATREWITYLSAASKIYLVLDHNPLQRLSCDLCFFNKLPYR